jgi:uncharacterized protein (DUF1800 family)
MNVQCRRGRGRRGWLAIGVSQWVLFALAGGILTMTTTAEAQTAPKLRAAVSRMSHHGRVFDVALPLTGASGIESRSTSGGLTVGLIFDQPVSAAQVALATGRGTISSTKFAGPTVLVNLTGVANAEELTLTASNVTATNGGAVLTRAAVKVRVLEGDVDADGKVTQADLNLAKSADKSVSGIDFRRDINLSGTLTAADVNKVKSRVGTALGAAATNTAPLVGKLGGSLRAYSGRPTQNIGFAVADAESLPSSLSITATSDNTTLIPDSSISIISSGDGSTRTFSVTPASGRTGTAKITVTVADGLAVTTREITVNVAPPPTMYLTYLRPQAGGTYTLGSGNATLALSGDETSAAVTFEFSNLTGIPQGARVRGPASEGANAGVLFDTASVAPNMDGSYTWTFQPVGSYTPADIANFIKTGQTYFSVDTPLYSIGEVRGQFQLASAQLPFTPPPAPPSLPGGTPTDSDAARFLMQATYGPNEQSIAEVKAMGFENWLAQQFDMPPSFTTNVMKERQANGEVSQTQLFNDAWWNRAATAPDQLRQRVAFALSQIVVISSANDTIDGHPDTTSTYYDLLLADAFKNYRTLLEDITLHPGMGLYLNMQGNRAAYVPAGQTTTINPNENYAREILQLFSIGLNILQPDGTVRLGLDGQPIPSYNQAVVQGFARVFTGWNWHNANPGSFPNFNPPSDYVNGMTLYPSFHETGTKMLLSYSGDYSPSSTDIKILPANQGGAKDISDALNQIYNHPNTGPFISKQLIQRLVTDNPSPGYVYRVSKVFADNGNGIRGDMRAVVRAILLDYEARSPQVLTLPGYGKLREPVLRVTALVRALHPASFSGYWKIASIGTSESSLAQTPMRASTVFNFFEPMYEAPGKLEDAGLVAPEMQITTDASAIAQANFINANLIGTFNGDVKLDLNTEIGILNQAGLSNTVKHTQLVSRLNNLLMAGNMSAGMQQSIIGHLDARATAGDTVTTRVQAAVQLVGSSSEFAAQK